jgi:hypothetical protein
VAPELTARLQAARAELAQGQAEHDAAVAALSDAAARAAREVLVEAEREAVALRASLADLLDQLAAQSPAPATRARSLRPDASVWTR